MKNDPAFPNVNYEGHQMGGLTKREYFSVRLLASMLSDLEIKNGYVEAAKITSQNPERVMASIAIYYADALIAELEKENGRK